MTNNPKADFVRNMEDMAIAALRLEFANSPMNGSVGVVAVIQGWRDHDV